MALFESAIVNSSHAEAFGNYLSQDKFCHEQSVTVYSDLTSFHLPGDEQWPNFLAFGHVVLLVTFDLCYF